MAKPQLTKQKAQWVKNRDVTLRGNRLNYNAALQAQYARDIERLIAYMIKQTMHEISNLFNSKTSVEFFKSQEKVAAMDASIASQARILLNKLTKRLTDIFGMKAKTLAERMIKSTLKISKNNLHSSLEQLTGGLSLKTGIVSKGLENVAKASIEENVALIKSIPQEYFKNVTGAVMRSITTGRGIADLIPEIQKYDGQTKRRGRNLALDQTRKAYNSINAQKMQSLNIKQFAWIHSGGGQTPRKSHQKIDGVIFSFENLYAEQAKLGVPESDRGIPGNAINCRCVMQPVIDFENKEA